jgi:activator of 2-hydroxyglutaryl-CoA dehydratase
LAAIVGTVSIIENVVVTGGCAINSKLDKGLGNQLKVQIRISTIDLKVIGASGAALLAQDKYGRI